MEIGIIALLVVLGIIVMVIVSSIRIVPQAHAFVVERLGGYLATWGVGIHFKIPLIDSVARVVSLKEQLVDFDPQAVITRDNVTIQVDTVVFFQITDPKAFTYGVQNPLSAIENLTATTLRNVIGDLELDESLTSRDVINTRIRAVLDEATDPWGIKINRVELKDIKPPKGIQDAMEKQMRAEREKREAILRSEGEKVSAILTAEGQKQKKILEAEADKAAVILAAEAQREASIREAEGEAEAILKVKQATADGLRMINESHPTAEALKLRAFEALEKVADGQATKIIIPSEIQNLAGLTSAISELVKKDN
ncbi:SPFH domain-containing protein [Entomospira culicis]|uniref:Protein QmcA n=1 Tax=Entomospira culicis TaxID=2719989 RepID=A0A968GKR8_9SPIO|nr:SPFH domain-containing protein [Entomospira culicis]NIZ19455.1 SPFH/Band 7/PHB domain protein [Entomospira culicis]NIZ69640.1 SPFH/Band 7/PHB domain protein [Entomospira culicis]WDI36751.1 SPFH/Band 7/PHB domain protein [Entomospira culicis]WDI38380.1 SPFH/Band 7/PHB domain protein [Entomospira culicis]